MSRWADYLKNHPVHEKLVQVRELLSKKPASRNADENFELKRLTKVADLIEFKLKFADPEMLAPGALDRISEALDHPSVRPGIENYLNNNDVALLQAANNHLNSLLPTVQAISTFGTQSAGSPQARAAEEHFNTFIALVSAHQAEIDSMIDEQQNSLSALQGKAENLESKLAELSTNFEGALAQWNTQFSEDQSKRATEFSTAQDSRNSEFAAWQIEFRTSVLEQVKNIIDAFELEIAELIQDSKEKHKTILDLHGLVAGDAVTAGYLGDGKKERDAANFWRIVTFVFILATACWLGYSFAFPYIHKIDTGEPWIYLLKSASLTGVLMFGAAYASRQSKSHRDQERKARWFGLEVKAFEPFVSSLDETQRKAMREKFADRMFGQMPDSGASKDAMEESDLVKTLLDIIAKAVPPRS